MQNTTTNRQLLNRLQALCEGTPYELRIRERENNIGLNFYTSADAPEYTPYMCVEDKVCFTGASASRSRPPATEPCRPRTSCRSRRA